MGTPEVPDCTPGWHVYEGTPTIDQRCRCGASEFARLGRRNGGHIMIQLPVREGFVIWKFSANIELPEGHGPDTDQIIDAVRSQGGELLGGGWEPYVPGAGIVYRVRAIEAMHTKSKAPGGSTDGSCAECSWAWPCPTYHVANGWDNYFTCIDERWCHHLNESME